MNTKYLDLFNVCGEKGGNLQNTMWLSFSRNSNQLKGRKKKQKRERNMVLDGGEIGVKSSSNSRPACCDRKQHVSELDREIFSGAEQHETISAATADCIHESTTVGRQSGLPGFLGL